MTTPEKIIKFIESRKDIISVSAIANASGISPAVLHNAIKGNKDGGGYTITIPEKHWPNLIATLKRIGIKKRIE